MSASGNLIGISFQIDKYGDANLKIDKCIYPRSILDNSSYVPITQREFDRAGEGLRVAADAHNAPGDTARPRRESDGPADQAHADDRDLLE
jgi:hypothetical protein